MTVDGAAVPCGILVVDDDLRVLEVNLAAAALLGRPIEALRGCTFPDLLSGAGRMFLRAHVVPAVGVTGHVEEIYLHLRCADGGEVPVVLNAARSVASGSPQTTFVFLPMRRRQVYEHELQDARGAAEASAKLEREAQAEIARAHAQLALQERLASLGTLAHGIAHEINNPLTYVAANLELLADALRGAEPLDRADLSSLVADALEGTERIREITRQMGHLVRADEMPRVTLDPLAVASLVVRMTKVHTRARAQVELVLGEVPLVDADSGRLGQVLINLVVNAVQAFGDRPAAENRVVIRTGTGPDGWARIEVEDNGPGIPAEVASRVFEPFFTTKPVGEGTGLGLSISRGLVESLGGTLGFEPAPGVGTVFRVALPPSATPRGPPPVAPGDGPRRARVLVVDDDQGVARAVARVLRRYDVTTALSSEEALARIRSGPPFDLVLTDLQMPRQDGVALYDAIAALDPSLARRMAIVTGASADDAHRLTSRGLRVFLKPIDVAQLLAFCEQQLGNEPAAGG